MKPIWELENSDNIIERQEYVKRIKTTFLSHYEKQLKILTDPHDIELQNNLIKNIKIKLSNYEIYKQQFKCRTCEEIQCICDEFAFGNQILGQRNDNSYKVQQSAVGEFAEFLQGESGNSDGNNEEPLPF